MGNCAPKPKPRSRPAQHSSSLLTPDFPAVRLYGPESCPICSCLRVALLYKSVPFQFVPRSYGQLAEVVLEHAQMEERLLFPAFESVADRGVCKLANEEHARDLPIINGIKEDIKSMVVMEAGTPFHQEALLNLSLRLKTLEEHFKGHFQEEEKNMLPLLEMAMRSQREEGEDESSSRSWMEQVLVLMEATHSPRLFPFFMAGLLPEEAMQYVGLVCRQTADQQRLASMLRSLITVLETKQSIVGILRQPT